MSLLRDGVAVRGDQPRFAGGQQIAQLAQGRPGQLRRTNFKTGTIDRIELPRRYDRHHTGRQLHVHKLARRAPFDLNATRAPPVQRMPAVINDDILPDMGRMTVQL